MPRRGLRLILIMTYIKRTDTLLKRSYKSYDLSESQKTEFINYQSGSASEPTWLWSMIYKEETWNLDGQDLDANPSRNYTTKGMFEPEKTNDCTFELIED